MRLNCRNTEPIKFQNCDTIKETKYFTYLGAVLSTEQGCDKDMDSRLSKAEEAFRKLNRIWAQSSTIGGPRSGYLTP